MTYVILKVKCPVCESYLVTSPVNNDYIKLSDHAEGCRVYLNYASEAQSTLLKYHPDLKNI